MSKKQASEALRGVQDRKIHVIEDFTTEDIRAFEKEVKLATRNKKKVTVVLIEK